MSAADDMKRKDALLDGIIVEPSGCWSHVLRPRYDGYRRVHWQGRRVQAHRLTYEWFSGPIQAGLVIDHLCRNPGCINPGHLEPVTQAENVQRGNSGHINANKTACIRGHEFTAENTFWTGGRRECRTCRRLTSNARAADPVRRAKKAAAARARREMNPEASRAKNAEQNRAYRARKKAAA